MGMTWPTIGRNVVRLPAHSGLVAATALALHAPAVRDAAEPATRNKL